MGKIIHPSAIGRPTTWMEDFTKIRQSPIPWMPTTHSLEGKRFLGKSQNALFRLQIWNTRAKPQWIAATRLLYHLQPSVLFKSSTKDLDPPRAWNWYSERLGTPPLVGEGPPRPHTTVQGHLAVPYRLVPPKPEGDVHRRI